MGINLGRVIPLDDLRETGQKLEPLLALVADDLEAINRIILDKAVSDVEMIPELAHHLIDSGGKRLRPMLALASAKLCGYGGNGHIRTASAVEFMHTATLLHDDVVDESTMRRGNATANETFGNPASVLVGDFLYSRAFQMMVEAQDMRIMAVLADATNVIAEGEVLQLMNMHNAGLDEAGYLQVIRSKTAKLFEASARVGAILSNAPADLEDACANYGQALGTAFQVIDDVLDYAGDANIMGKNLGDDLREGKATLPLISAMHRGTLDQRRTIERAIEQGDVGMLDQVVRIVHETGALQVARLAAAAEARRAISEASRLPETPHAKCLIQLAAQLLERQH